MKMNNRVRIYLIDLMAIFIMFLGITIKSIAQQGPDTVKDIDGNIYNTVRIGMQTWMTENLKTTKLNDGTEITLVVDSLEWQKSTAPAYCWYENDSSNKNIYGALYNWHTVGTNKLCPNGWHVPSNTEWKTLTVYLGGESVAGGRLKEAGTLHWKKPNTGATNKSGFTGLPGGFRHAAFSRFYYAGFFGYWWTSTALKTEYARHRHLGYEYKYVFRNRFHKRTGFSVRCLKD